MNRGEAQQIFDGSMLGDASIKEVWGKRSINPTCVYAFAQTGNDHIDSIENIKSALTTLGVSTSEIKPYNHKGLSSGHYNGFHSHACEYIKLQCSRWYKDRIKIVPPDLTLTPLMLARFFMDDGMSTYDKRNDAVIVRLASCSFSEQENVSLMSMLHNMDIDSTKAHSYRLPVISIRQGSVDIFMDVVEPFIVPSFMYKIKHRGSYKGPIAYRLSRKDRSFFSSLRAKLKGA